MFEPPRRLISKDTRRTTGQREAKKAGCCEVLCRIFGLGENKRRNNGDYVEIKEVL